MPTSRVVQTELRLESEDVAGVGEKTAGGRRSA